ncbi:MAG: hemerythrin domain-containing protein [Kofleriaceae bacterium]|nr:hemerythrin domain-containing protein [Kofleriaceae bacterium]
MLRATPSAMLLTLGARNQVDELVDLLAVCHRKIRQHLVLARRLVLQGPTTPAPEVAETAAQIRRYFTVALPLHVADEDLSIAPRLPHAGGELGAAVAQVASDHAKHQAMIDMLVALCSEVERDPTRVTTLAERLAAVLDALAPELAGHLDLEERVVFPAVRALPTAVRAAILDEMRARRG